MEYFTLETYCVKRYWHLLVIVLDVPMSGYLLDAVYILHGHVYHNGYSCYGAKASVSEYSDGSACRPNTHTPTLALAPQYE